MTDWLQRARCELGSNLLIAPSSDGQISKSAADGAANAAERTLTAALAAPQPDKSQEFETHNGNKSGTPPPAFQENHIPPSAVPPLSKEEEAWLRAWLDHIDETDPEGIAVLMNKCRIDIDARRYFLKRARGEICLVNPKMDAYFSEVIDERKTRQE